MGQNGILEKSKEAVEKYKKAEEDEGNVIEKLADKLENINIDYNDYIGAYVEGYNLEKKKYTVTSAISGANNDQTFETETDMKWRIWSYDGNILRLISDKPTNTKLTLKGAAGYNNAVWALNEITRQCYGQYDNNGKKKEGIDVASLKRSDIEKVIKYNYILYSHNDDSSDDEKGNGIIKFAEEKEYNKSDYPIIWEKDKAWEYEYKEGIGPVGKDQEGEIWEKEYEPISDPEKQSSVNKESSILVKQSFWKYVYNNETVESDWINEKYLDVLFGKATDNNNDSWIACRYSFINPDSFNFGLYCCLSNRRRIDGNPLYKPFEESKDDSSGKSVRPIISINLKSSGYKLEKNVNNEKISFNLVKK